VGFDAVADDAAITVCTGWRQHMDRAFETVECVFLASQPDGKCFVVVIPAHVAFSHRCSSFNNFAAAPESSFAFIPIPSRR